ncbi:MAG: hypothetical protein SNJ72_01840, partial [Fimbriimonadales bacterium]
MLQGSEEELSEYIDAFMAEHDQRKADDYSSYNYLLDYYVGRNGQSARCLRAVMLGYLQTGETVVGNDSDYLQTDEQKNPYDCGGCSVCRPELNFMTDMDWRRSRVQRLLDRLDQLLRDLESEFIQVLPSTDWVETFWREVQSERDRGRAIDEYLVGFLGRILDETPDHKGAHLIRLDTLYRASQAGETINLEEYKYHLSRLLRWCDELEKPSLIPYILHAVDTLLPDDRDLLWDVIPVLQSVGDYGRVARIAEYLFTTEPVSDRKYQACLIATEALERLGRTDEVMQLAQTLWEAHQLQLTVPAFQAFMQAFTERVVQIAHQAGTPSQVLAFRWLHQVASEQSIEALRGLLRHADAGTRCLAVEHLEVRWSEAVERDLVEAVLDGEEAVQRAAVRRLGESSSVLARSVRRVCYEVAELRSEVGDGVLAFDLREAVLVVVEYGAVLEPLWWRALVGSLEVRRALVQVGEVVIPGLRRALARDERVLALEALKILAEIGTDEALNVLLECLRHPSEAILDQVCSLLEDHRQPDWLWRAVEILQSAGDYGRVARIAEHLFAIEPDSDRRYQACQTAIEAFEQLDQPDQVRTYHRHATKLAPRPELALQHYEALPDLWNLEAILNEIVHLDQLRSYPLVLPLLVERFMERVDLSSEAVMQLA